WTIVGILHGDDPEGRGGAHVHLLGIGQPLAGQLGAGGGECPGQKVLEGRGGGGGGGGARPAARHGEPPEPEPAPRVRAPSARGGRARGSRRRSPLLAVEPAFR